MGSRWLNEQGSTAEQIGHVLPCAQQQARAFHFGLRHQRGFAHRLALRGRHHLADHGTLGDGGLKTRLELDRGLHWLATRHGEHPRCAQNGRDRVGLAKADLGRGNDRRRRDGCGFFKLAVTPGQQLARLVRARLGAVGVQDDRDQAHVVALGGCDQAKARL